MTSCTISDGSLDIQKLLLFCGKLRLVGRRGPGHVGDLAGRSQMIIGITMTGETPAHAERFLLSHHFHFCDVTMTAGTTDTHIDVCGVIKIDIVRRLVDADPFQGGSILETFPDQGQLFAVRFDHVMTIHTGFCRGNPGDRRCLHTGVTKTTV